MIQKNINSYYKDGIKYYKIHIGKTIIDAPAQECTNILLGMGMIFLLFCLISEMDVRKTPLL